LKILEQQSDAGSLTGMPNARLSTIYSKAPQAVQSKTWDA
jgi:hypothetical protein